MDYRPMAVMRCIIFNCIIFFLLIFQTELWAQEAVGLSLSNYGGVNVLRVNPANILQSKAHLQIHVVGSNVFLRNNFVYWQKSDQKIPKFLTEEIIFKDYFIELKESLNYNKNIDLKSFNLVGQVNGPGFMLHLGKWAYGINTSFRSYTSMDRLPYELPVFGWETLSYTPLQNINFKDANANFAAVNWGELIFSGAYRLKREIYNDWSIGINVKRLYGYNAFFVKGIFGDYLLRSSKWVEINKLDLYYGFSTTMDLDTNTLTSGKIQVNGKGLGFDIGVNFTKRKVGYQNPYDTRKCELPYEEYYWRVGVSLLDMGSIQFKKNAQFHQFHVENKSLDRLDTIEFTSLQAFMDDASLLLLESADASRKDDHFKIGLPSAVSVQFDAEIRKPFYLSVLFIQPFKISEYTMIRPAQLYVVPRYELPFIEVSMPLSLYRYEILRMGMAVRMGFITIGTESIASIFGKSNNEGLNAYVSLQFLMPHGECWKKKKTGACETTIEPDPFIQ